MEATDAVDELPIGRRVAYWRRRRRLSQQVFADRLGKSKSWVDKVERGVRSLDKVSVLQEIATVLRIDTAVLLGRDVTLANDGRAPVAGVEQIRVVLGAYEIPLERPSSRLPPVPVNRMAATVEHAWTTYQHARYPQLIRLLPDLLRHTQRTHAHHPDPARRPLVEAYRVTAALLVKLGEADLAWMAVDRAMIAATGEPELVAAAAVQLGQALRAAGRPRMAKSTMLAAAYRVAPPVLEYGLPPELSLCGTLLVQAALAAARAGDDSAAAELLDEATGMAERVGDGQDHYRTCFGSTTVDLARTAVAVELGDAREAVTWHEKATTRDGWRWLPPEPRAAHLVDAARAYVHAGTPVAAGQALLAAERVAPDEVRIRPVVREVLAAVVRNGAASSPVLQLADTLGVV